VTSSLSVFFLEEGVSFGVDQNIETQFEFVAESDFSTNKCKEDNLIIQYGFLMHSHYREDVCIPLMQVSILA